MKVTILYYCAECDTSKEMFVESTDGKINFKSLQKSIPCRKTKKCREMLLTNLAIPDNVKTNESHRIDG